MLDLVQLQGLEHRKPSQLSGGQQQRVALARALVLTPRVLLLDEPLGALDARLRKSLQVELKALQADVGVTFVFVTHDQEEALTMSDRLAVMNNGKVEQAGSPREVYEEPTTSFVADFLGVSNLLDAEATARSAKAATSGSGERSFLARRGEIGSRGRVKAMIRPERLERRAPGQRPATTGSRGSWSVPSSSAAHTRSTSVCWGVSSCARRSRTTAGRSRSRSTRGRRSLSTCHPTPCASSPRLSRRGARLPPTGR